MLHPPFERGATGLTRFPPNIETVRVEPQGAGRILLMMRRNDVKLEFLLASADAVHLAAALSDAAAAVSTVEAA